VEARNLILQLQILVTLFSITEIYSHVIYTFGSAHLVLKLECVYYVVLSKESWI
jgi:hypothetical protein